MEVAGTVFRPLPSFISSGREFYSNSCSKPSLSVVSFDGGNQLLGSRVATDTALGSNYRKIIANCVFSDKGHIQYYSSSKSTRGIRCGSSGKIDNTKEATDIKKEKKKMKKKLKLVGGLPRDLSMFTDLGFGLDGNNHGLVDQVDGNMMSEAKEMLLGQLQQLRAEEELKRKRKEEKAKMKAAAKMQKRLKRESSSSSSSESSDSECGEVVGMGSLKRVAALEPPVVAELQAVMQEATLQLQNTLTQEASTTELQSVIRDAHATLTIPSTMYQKGTTIDNGGIVGSGLQGNEQPGLTPQTSTRSRNCSVGMAGGGASSVKTVEVCMGGKCKKSGAAALVDEFQRVLGDQGSVVGCKCMGKCRDGPNVRIVEDSVRAPTNPLCIGVGFEDVGSIVANFLGEKHKELGLAAAS